MSISNAFNISNTGLAATSQWAETVSSNIANADRPGYGRRSLDFATTGTGGVVTTGMVREADEALVGMYREEVGRLSRQDAIASGLTTYTASLGEVDGATTPAARLTELQASLDLLFNEPSDVSAQRGAVQAAQSVAGGLNDLSAGLNRAARDTRSVVQADVTKLNGVLAEVADLNRRVELTEPGTLPRTVIEDEMAQALDGLSELMSFRTDVQSSGRVDLYTDGGARLVEGDRALEVQFDATAGSLSVSGVDITPPSVRGSKGGTIAGGLELLNEVLPRMQLQLDEYARALVQNFESQDASLAPGEAGLFTDAGGPLDLGATTGLAGRIAVNDAVVPEEGGMLWRIRDGMGAGTPGTASDPSQVGAFIDGLEARQNYDVATGLPSDISLGDYAASMMAQQKTTLANAQETRDGLAASAAALESAKLGAQGVNVDDELQQLIRIEQSYAANSRVLTTLSEMLDTLLNAV